ncbi:MAG TPA: hypothetical protein VMP08_15960 [Anaerolineae bacterium]|nr:hypothetical protein [Anaerolineae bacterium]
MPYSEIAIGVTQQTGWFRFYHNWSRPVALDELGISRWTHPS